MLDAAIQLWARQQPVVVAAVDDDNLGRNTNQLGLLTNAVSFGILVLTMVGGASFPLYLALVSSSNQRWFGGREKGHGLHASWSPT
jgi:hypothetical protein